MVDFMDYVSYVITKFLVVVDIVVVLVITSSVLFS